MSRESTTVLIVDDDLAMSRLLSLVLRSEGFEVLTAHGGHEALSILESPGNTPEIIILDLMMPAMSGREFFRQARQAGYTGPILICSAYGAEEANQGLGGQGAIVKPFDPERLVAMVRELVHEQTRAKEDCPAPNGF